MEENLKGGEGKEEEGKEEGRTEGRKEGWKEREKEGGKVSHVVQCTATNGHVQQ